MIFRADESVDRQIVDRLRQTGYEVIDIAEKSPGVSDQEVLETAGANRALILTADKDFGELVFRQRLHAHGVLLIRLAGRTQDKKVKTVLHAIEKYGDQMHGAFSVLTPGLFRIRRPI